MAFNFGSLANIPTSNNTTYLKPYNIYENVSIDSIEIKEGTSDKGNSWKSLRITFKSPEGVYTENIWYPKEGDEVRKEVSMANGDKRYRASNFEVTMAMVAAIGNAFNPEGFKKLQELSKNFRTFDDVTKGLMTILNKNKDVTTSMKLVGKTSTDGKVYARLPQPLGIAQNKETGEWYTFPVAIFGNNLTFTPYEQGQSDKYHNARPTAVGDSKVDTDPINDFDNLSGASEDINFTELLGGL